MASCKPYSDETNVNINFIKDINNLNETSKQVFRNRLIDIDMIINIANVLANDIDCMYKLKGYDSFFTKNGFVITDLNSYLGVFNKLTKSVQDVFNKQHEILSKIKKIEEFSLPIPKDVDSTVTLAKTVAINFFTSFADFIEKYKDIFPNIYPEIKLLKHKQPVLKPIQEPIQEPVQQPVQQQPVQQPVQPVIKQNPSIVNPIQDNNICKRNVDSTTYIYHYINEIDPLFSFQDTDNIKYIKIKNINELKKVLESDLCKDNIVIYGKSYYDKKNNKNVDISVTLNNLLTNLNISKNKQYKNITIIHETNDTRKLVYKIYTTDNKLLFNKIINIFPTGEQLYINYILEKDNSVKYNIDELKGSVHQNRTIDAQVRKLNTNNVLNLVFPPQGANIHGTAGGFKKYKQIGGLQTDISFQLKYTKSDSKKLIDQWWYKWYFSIPPCATGRLTQLSGTCWFNSTLNSLILTPKIAAIMKNRFYEWINSQTSEVINTVTETSFQNCPMLNTKLEILLYIVIFNIIIKSDKARSTDDNFIAELASRTKSLGETGSDSDYLLKKGNVQAKTLKDLKEVSKYGDGYDPSKGCRIIFNTLFESNYNYYTIIDCNIKNKNIDKYNILARKYNRTRSLELKREVDRINNILNDPKKYNKYYNFFNNTIDIPNITSKEINQNELSNIKWTVDTNPMIILVLNNNGNLFKKGRSKIIINNRSYSLESSNIDIDTKHAVAALRCGTTQYIYDSNNFLAKCNWQNGDISEYIKLINSEGASYGNLIYTSGPDQGKSASYGGMFYLIYVRDDIVSGGMNKEFNKWKKQFSKNQPPQV